MELDKLLVILVVLLSSVHCQDSDGWTGELEQDKWPNSAVIQDLLVRLTRKPASPRKHLGLRRKDSTRLQTVPKRHNFQTFVGLMGKRNFEQQGEP
ncbi:uncharacterized protein LOC142902065 isoform X2 [Nelusetta ayraudi]|uniref:uncharacterized protein LOC142902065 isoform X2 n=1 Tax=Nelusetta ayraudi TaxID=303726 RepID=UPI003F71155C